MNRTEMIAAMDDPGSLWDVIIIGGGATGLGAAVESAARGHRTVLVEAADFAKGTSSRSTKLIHGGVRYLRQGRVGMVRQSLRERGLLFRNAPHVVHPLNFVLPTYRFGSRLFYYTGLRVYDLLAGKLRCGRTRQLSREETCRELPTLREDNLRGGVVYSDGQFDDARLAITLARTAVDLGAVVANYVPVTRLLNEGGRVRGVVIRDLESDREIPLRGKVVINATGVFAETILRMDGDRDHQPIIAPSQGSHLILDASFLPGSSALMIPQTDDGRVLFAIPWHGKVLLGTTDLAVREVSDEPRPRQSEVDYLLEHAGRYLKHQPNEADIRSRFAGLRPLVGPRFGQRSTSKLSREHEIHTSSTGLVTVIGGKWTTYRQMGEDLINQAESAADLRRLSSRTATLRLHGCPEPGSRAASGDPDFAIYGSDAQSLRDLILESAELCCRLHPLLPYCAAEVVWAARHEMARSVEDIFARRTRALFLNARAAIDSAPQVAELLQQELQKSESWKNEQIRQFSLLAEHYC